MEITWDLQNLKFQLEDQYKMWQGKFWQSPTAVLLSLSQGPRVPKGNEFFFLKLYILLVYWMFIVTFLSSYSIS
jgi:hypothetical protein